MTPDPTQVAVPLAALGCAAGAGWLATGTLTPRVPTRLLTRPAPGGGGAAAVMGPAAWRRLPWPFAGAVPLAFTVVVLTGSAVPGLLTLGAATAVERARRARRAAAVAAARRAAVLELCGVLVSELRAGRAAPEALAWASGVNPQLDRLLSPALRYGQDVPATLSAAGYQAGAEGLRRLAACWRVAQGGGAGLADAVDRLGSGLRAELAVRREVAAQLAGPRATARLLAILPVFGLGLAEGLGGDPLRVLLRTPYGLACLGAGLVLDVAGVLWTERIARSAEQAAA